MSLDLANILSINYLFNLNPGPALPVFFKTLVPFFSTFIILGLVAQKTSKRAAYAPIKKFFAKLFKFCLTMGVLGLLLLLFRQLGALFLAAPFWLLLWGVGTIVWLGFILKFYFTDRPKQLAEIETRVEKQKYLPS